MARNILKMENNKCTLQDREYGEKHLKMWKMRNEHCRTWKLARKLKNVEKCVTNTVLPGIWQETVKNMKNEKCTPQDLDYGEKTEKRGKLDQHIV